ncbi:TPA: hypothetical protein I8Z16_001730 [Legionella pneumophila]|nr:hypothetical protein [Legionella pneumophila]
MTGLKARIDKLYSGSISHVTSKIIVYKDDKIIKQKVIGNNKEKVIEIAVRL